MANDWDYTDPADDTPLVQKLRQELEKRGKELREATDKIGKLEVQVRKRSIADVLQDIGVPPKISAFIPSDLDPTKENLEKWVDDFRDVFNIPAKESAPAEEPQAQPAVQPDPAVSPEMQAAWQRIQTAEASAGTTTPDGESQALARLKLAEKASGGDIAKYVAMVNGEIPLPTN